METIRHGDVFVKRILLRILVCLHGNVSIFALKWWRCYFGAITMAASSSATTMDQTATGKGLKCEGEGIDSDREWTTNEGKRRDSLRFVYLLQFLCLISVLQPSFFPFSGTKGGGLHGIQRKERGKWRIVHRENKAYTAQVMVRAFVLTDEKVELPTRAMHGRFDL